MNKTTEVFESKNSNYSSTSVERALKLAEEALEELHYSSGTVKAVTLYRHALAAIREALAEPVKQEPVAWGWVMDGEVNDCIGPTEHARCEGEYTVPLYASPVDAKSIRALKLVYDNSTSHDWPEDIWDAIVDGLYEEHRKTMATAPQLLGD